MSLDVDEIVLTFEETQRQTCCAKKMCYFARIDDKPVVIKHFLDNTSVVFDRIKPLFGLGSNDSLYVRLPLDFTLDYQSRGVRIPVGDVLREYRFETEKKAKKNEDGKRPLAEKESKIYRVVKTPRLNTFLVMKRHVNAVSIRDKFKQFIVNKALVREYVKIGRVRTTLLQITDFNTANVVYDSDANLLFSIDENGMGTCKTKDSETFKNIRAHVPNLSAIIREVDKEILDVINDPTFEERLRGALEKIDVQENIDRILDLVAKNRAKLV